MKTKVLFFLALLRIKRPENLKEHAPAALGQLLGLDPRPARITGQDRGLAPWSGAPYLWIESDR